MYENLLCIFGCRMRLVIESVINNRTNKKTSFVYQTKDVFLNDVFRGRNVMA